MIKAVFFDIDGTLVSFQTHTVPPSTVRALHLLREQGVKVFISTGRAMRSIDNLGDLSFDGYVTLNGGICYEGKERIFYRHPIPPSDIEALLQLLQRRPFPCGLVTEHAILHNYINARVEEIYALLNFPTPPVVDLSELNGAAVYQLIAFFTQEEEAEIMSFLPGCVATRWNPLFTDVVAKGSSKAVGIEQMAAHFGLSVEETMAFGDGGNDVAMLRRAGIGVAMGNAEASVQREADYVTTSVDEDGVWNALRHFGLIQL